MKRAGAVLTAAFFFSTVTAHAAAPNGSPKQPETSPGISPIANRAKEWFYRFERGEMDRSQLNAAMNIQLTDAVFHKEGETLRAFGTLSSFTFARTYMIAGDRGYDFVLDFPSGRIVEMMAFDPDGKIAGIDFMTFVKAKK